MLLKCVYGIVYLGVGYMVLKVVLYVDDLWCVVDVFNVGLKVVLLVGVGVLKVIDEVIVVVDWFGVGVVKVLFGKVVLLDDLLWVIGLIGLFGIKLSYELMIECDMLLVVGLGFLYLEFLLKEG